MGSIKDQVAIVGMGCSKFGERWEKGPDRYLPLFERVDSKPIIIKALRGGKTAHKFYVYKYYGFKGKYEERVRE